MNLEKHNQQLSMKCPSCGNTKFISSDEDSKVVCARCDHQTSRKELIASNQKHIKAVVNDVKKKVVKDVELEVKKMFKKAFGGSRGLKIKL